MDWQALRTQLEELLDLPHPVREQRLSALPEDQAQQLRRLLEADSSLGDFLVPPDTDAVAESLGRLPERIGPWRVLSLLGVGGSATVYEAEGGQPSRRVALKVCRDPLPSGAARQRFAVEAATLARLNHPAIAQVHEATMVEGSVPVFALELVERARTLVEWVREQALTLEQTLLLFGTVCDAVHHAHQRGVIHRDIKGPNVLVDGDGHPKVIDFGVARLTDPSRTLHTTPGEVLGTLSSMAPEQLSGDPDDVDTRADVYALGALLYELVCARPALDLSGQPLAEAARIVREDAPARPTLVSPAVPADVEAILLKALEKQPDRRYPSAAALAEDLRRMLRLEPVSARPPSLAYHARTFARRHRALVTGGAVAALALVVATAVSVNYALQASGAAEREGLRAEEADLARLQAQSAAEAATAAAEAEAEQRARAEQALAATEVQRAKTEALFERILGTSQDFVIEAATALAGTTGALAEQSLLLGRAVEDLGVLHEMAPDDHELALELGEASTRLGGVLGTPTSSHAGAYAEALAAHDQAVALARHVLDGRPADVRALELEVDALRNASAVLHSLGRLDEAEQRLDDALLALDRLPEDPGDVVAATRRLNVWDALAVTHREQGDTMAAGRELRAVLEGYDVLVERFPDDLFVATMRCNTLIKLSSIARQKGLYADAAGAASAAAGALEALHARDGTNVIVHESLTTALQVRGQAELLQGKLDEAEATLARASEELTELIAADPEDVEHLHDLVLLLYDLGNVARQKGEDLAAVADAGSSIDGGGDGTANGSDGVGAGTDAPSAAETSWNLALDRYRDCRDLVDGLRGAGQLQPRFDQVTSKIDEQIRQTLGFLGQPIP
jgi:tetratricopeptide (TPR) repeat protein